MKQTLIKISPIFLSLFALVSCLKKGDMNIDADNTNTVVMFNNTGDNLAAGSAPNALYFSDMGVLKPGDTSHFNINLLYAGAGEAPQDITVNLAIDQAALDNFNTSQATSYKVPPAGVATFPTSIVIKKGTKTAQTHVVIKRTADYDFGAAYGLPLKITSVSSGAISANLATALYSFGVRNQYDGHYSLHGYTLRAGDPAKTGSFVYPKGMDLVTVGPSSLQFAELQPWTDLTGVGVGNPIVTVNADNSVTISNSTPIKNDPGYTSRYDPAKKTFYISFTWGGGPASRLATDTLVYVGPRP